MKTFEITETFHIEAETKEDAAALFFDVRERPGPTHITIEDDDGREYNISGPDGEVDPTPRQTPRFEP